MRRRVVAQLRNVADELAQGVAEGLGIGELPEPLPAILKRPPKPEVERSPALSMFARPGRRQASARAASRSWSPTESTGPQLRKPTRCCQRTGAVPRYVASKMGAVDDAAGDAIEVEVSLEAAPSGALGRSDLLRRR